MRSLKIYFLLLFFTATLLFNIERLDLNQENILDIQTFVYFLAPLIITAIILIPFFGNYRVPWAMAFALGLYLVCKLLLFRERPLFGGLYTYVSITEAAFLVVIAFLSHRLSHSIQQFQEGFTTMTMHLNGRYLQNTTVQQAAIQREISRSRHYHRPLSVIVVKLDEETLEFALPTLFGELQKTLIHRFARLKLAQTMQKHLRVVDFILEEGGSNDFIIVCPEADGQGSSVIIERVQSVLNQSGVSAKYSTATFPNEALTFEGLVNQAQTKLAHPENTPPEGIPDGIAEAH